MHALQGRLAEPHVVWIDLQYHITLELELREGEILLVSVGSHGESWGDVLRGVPEHLADAWRVICEYFGHATDLVRLVAP